MLMNVTLERDVLKENTPQEQIATPVWKDAQDATSQTYVHPALMDIIFKTEYASKTVAQVQLDMTVHAINADLDAKNA